MILKLKSLISLAVDVSPSPETIKRTVTVNDFADMLKKIETNDVEQWKRVAIDGEKRMRVNMATEEFIPYITNEYNLFIQHTENFCAI